MLRSLSLHLRDEPETQLPLTREEDLIKTDDVLDLSKLSPSFPNILWHRKTAGFFFFSTKLKTINR